MTFTPSNTAPTTLSEAGSGPIIPVPLPPIPPELPPTPPEPPSGPNDPPPEDQTLDPPPTVTPSPPTQPPTSPPTDSPTSPPTSSPTSSPPTTSSKVSASTELPTTTTLSTLSSSTSAQPTEVPVSYFIIPSSEVAQSTRDAFTARLQAETDPKTLGIAGKWPVFWIQHLTLSQVDLYKKDPAVSSFDILVQAGN